MNSSHDKGAGELPNYIKPSMINFNNKTKLLDDGLILQSEGRDFHVLDYQTLERMLIANDKFDGFDYVEKPDMDYFSVIYDKYHKTFMYTKIESGAAGDFPYLKKEGIRMTNDKGNSFLLDVNMLEELYNHGKYLSKDSIKIVEGLMRGITEINNCGISIDNDTKNSTLTYGLLSIKDGDKSTLVSHDSVTINGSTLNKAMVDDLKMLTGKTPIESVDGMKLVYVDGDNYHTMAPPYTIKDGKLVFDPPAGSGRSSDDKTWVGWETGKTAKNLTNAESIQKPSGVAFCMYDNASNEAGAADFKKMEVPESFKWLGETIKSGGVELAGNYISIGNTTVSEEKMKTLTDGVENFNKIKTQLDTLSGRFYEPLSDFSINHDKVMKVVNEYTDTVGDSVRRFVGGAFIEGDKLSYEKQGVRGTLSADKVGLYNVASGADASWGPYGPTLGVYNRSTDNEIRFYFDKIDFQFPGEKALRNLPYVNMMGSVFKRYLNKDVVLYNGKTGKQSGLPRFDADDRDSDDNCYHEVLPSKTSLTMYFDKKTHVTAQRVHAKTYVSHDFGFVVVDTKKPLYSASYTIDDIDYGAPNTQVYAVAPIHPFDSGRYYLDTYNYVDVSNVWYCKARVYCYYDSDDPNFNICGGMNMQFIGYEEGIGETHDDEEHKPPREENHNIPVVEAHRDAYRSGKYPSPLIDVSHIDQNLIHFDVDKFESMKH